MSNGWYNCSKCGKENHFLFNESPPYVCRACEIRQEYGEQLIKQIITMIKESEPKGITTYQISKEIGKNYGDTVELLELIQLYADDLDVDNIQELFDDEVNMEDKWYIK